jgi:uncharacterized protein (UPF0548 family)
VRLEELVGRRDPQRLLEEMRRAPLNFDPSRAAHFTPQNGWHLDDFCQPLAPEPPGEPLPHGSFEVAKRLMRGYEFADPSLVRAFYDPEEPLEGRTMVLELRFHGVLRFHAGVRISGVHDERREVHGRPVHVWGWEYRTLQGHLEKGQMDWQVWKWIDTGEIEFRIHAFSRRSSDPNFIVRLGFQLFGRREQLAFLNSTLRRMARLTAAGVRGDEQALRDASSQETARAQMGEDEPVHSQLAENLRARA